MVATYIDGFEISGANDRGECIPKVTETDKEVIDYGDPVLKFKQDLSYGCSILKAQDELETFCKDPAVKDTVQGLQIFSNIMDEFQLYGKYGNANYLYPLDWERFFKKDDKAEPPVDELKALKELLGTAKWNENSKTCEIYSSLKITIFYHNRGYSENLQQYIADAKIEAVKENWKYPDRFIPEAAKDRKIHFDHMVSIQFVKLGTLEADEKGYI